MSKELIKQVNKGLCELEDQTTFDAAEWHLSQAAFHFKRYVVERNNGEKEQEKQKEIEKLEAEMKRMTKEHLSNAAKNRSSSGQSNPGSPSRYKN